jgi:hypothetical protein
MRGFALSPTDCVGSFHAVITGRHQSVKHIYQIETCREHLEWYF